MTSSKSNHASIGCAPTVTTPPPSPPPSSTTTATPGATIDSQGLDAHRQDNDEINKPQTQLVVGVREPAFRPTGAKSALDRIEATAAGSAGPMASSEPALMPPSTSNGGLGKKPSRLNRLSSFFLPSLTTTSSSEPPTVPAVHRKPIPTDSPIKEKHSSSSDWESIVRNRLDPANSDSSTLSGSLSVDGKKSTSTKSSQESAPVKMGKLQKSSQAPPAPTKAPPLPPRTADGLITPTDNSFQFSESKVSPKLTKQPPPLQRPRSSSHGGPASPPRQDGLASAGLAPSPIEPRGRSSSAQPPSNRLEPAAGNRIISASAALESRPASSHASSQSPTRENEKRGRLRRSWFPGSRSRSNSQDMRGVKGSGAWTLGPNKADYNTSFLEKGERVPELWNESGSVLVYLHPKGSGKGPSFKVMPFVTDYSLVFQDLIEAELNSPTSSGRSRTRSFTGRDSLAAADADRPPPSPESPPLAVDENSGDSRLYLPTSLDGSEPTGKKALPDVERLVSIRNMFALLTGQPLVGTKSQPTIFAAVMKVSGLLSEFEFTDVEGSTFGDAVNMSFGFFMDQMAVADVRYSREKTLEALLLGERMRSWDLYNEAFAHAAGKYSALRELKSPLWDDVSTHTRERLERGHLELLDRQNNVNNRLENFEFPALFSGTANSVSMYKDVKFGRWKSSFGRMRSFVLGYYKSNFGSWPPKARSKKNPFTESGLNRQVLKFLYSDLCALYDLLVDRRSVTTRSVFEDNADEDEGAVTALRRILTEFDQSSPPVLPPIPYDIPMLPSFKSVKENYYDLPMKEQRKLDSNYQEHEFLLILNKSYDFETLKLKLPFVEAFQEFELKEAKGKPISEIADQRLGYWLFLYVVIQSLPMLVVDAPGLQFTEGVEYFLCQAPKGQPPWVPEATEVRKRWYQVAGGNGYVELSEDTVEFSIEGIYHRSHCWVAAKQWEAGLGGPISEPQDLLPPLQAPQSVFTDMDPGVSLSPKLMPDRSESPQGSAPGMALRPRGGSPAGNRQSYRSSVAMGLEPVNMPGDVPDRRGSRVFSARSGSLGPRPSSAMMGRRRSSGNMIGMSSPVHANPESRASSRQDSPGGSTFDDILKDMDNKPKKKKNFFG
ncbi:hypothetical protein JX265_005297 [Neoarthrinium moseri]|uniref:DUF8004 domain-containing protein n=1 Tax=Neoarthrinium moseri TaxID=1658444 RepID=A0A9P9WNZ8_9PEZI|nr:uncharacterized protein JN550_006246 [Neoarthrinium moseri]KAI1845607.1 hypothetical protein JX266_008218 [Neoarthrinium moseri]KAI1868671.1 hypothetical protein JN550_006246 [Neoarthrinium moseri]KAI1872417.1 hypothetical protein JX265_005297 [Neoarthrinium moseri]